MIVGVPPLKSRKQLPLAVRAPVLRPPLTRLRVPLWPEDAAGVVEDETEVGGARAATLDQRAGVVEHGGGAADGPGAVIALNAEGAVVVPGGAEADVQLPRRPVDGGVVVEGALLEGLEWCR